MYRAVYFFPVVLSPVIIGTIFNTVLSADGPFNSLLETLHLPTNDWLGNQDTALFTVVGVQIWSTFGLAVTIFLAGLSTLDNEQIEAATLDGANLLQTIRHVIIPSLRPTIQFVVVTTTIGMLTGMFGLLFVMTAGGPFDSTYLPELYIWVKQGKDNRPALASAASMVLFAAHGGHRRRPDPAPLQRRRRVVNDDCHDHRDAHGQATAQVDVRGASGSRAG